MKPANIIGVVIGLALASFSVSPLTLAAITSPDMDASVHALVLRAMPKPPANAYTYSIYRTAPLQVALVYGRAQGCADADPALIESTARAAIDAGLDPAIAAATVAVESACNQYAVSTKGAVGLTQVNVKIWKEQFDFGGDVNLFNRDANLRTGMKIEARLIQSFGVADGVRRYNGTGVDCSTCDAGYTAKILTLAGRK